MMGRRCEEVLAVLCRALVSCLSSQPDEFSVPAHKPPKSKGSAGERGVSMSRGNLVHATQRCRAERRMGTGMCGVRIILSTEPRRRCEGASPPQRPCGPSESGTSAGAELCVCLSWKEQKAAGHDLPDANRAILYVCFPTIKNLRWRGGGNCCMNTFFTREPLPRQQGTNG